MKEVVGRDVEVQDALIFETVMCLPYVRTHACACVVCV